MTTLDRIGELLPGTGALGDRPLRVLIASGGATDEQGQDAIDAMTELRVDLTSLSSQGASITLPDASHVTIVTERHHAAAVSDAILDIWEAAQ